MPKGKQHTLDVNAFLRATNGIMRDTLAALAADLQVSPSFVSIAYVYDEQTSAFGWRAGVNDPDSEVMAYAFDPDMVNAIEKLSHGMRRLAAGEATVSKADNDDDEPIGRVIN